MLQSCKNCKEVQNEEAGAKGTTVDQLMVTEFVVTELRDDHTESEKRGFLSVDSLVIWSTMR